MQQPRYNYRTPPGQDPAERQCVQVNSRFSLHHYYNQHNQNPIVVLPGDILFCFHSQIHQHMPSETLIIRSLPSLNTLLRELGPRITPLEIWRLFKFIGVCEKDWTVNPKRPLLRGIRITHMGRQSVPHIFDDVSESEPMLPRSLPRHAFLWLRPYEFVPGTDRAHIRPFLDRLLPMDGETDLEIEPSKEPAAEEKLSMEHFAEPEDETQLLAELDAWGDEFGLPQAAPAAKPREEKKDDTATSKDPEYFWQFAPVCSTHADLQHGGESAALRAVDGKQRLFQHYRFAIYLGLMYSYPRHFSTPQRIHDPIVTYATFGPLGDLARYQSTMLDHRHLLRWVDIDSQSA